MLQLVNVSFAFASHVLFNDVSIVVNPGDRVGVVGPNGCGKSTLLKLMAGRLEPTSGAVSSRKGIRFGLLEQVFEPPGEAEVGHVLTGGALLDARQRVERLAAEISAAAGPAQNSAMDGYAAALDEFEKLGGYAIEDRARTVLAGLGLARLDLAAKTQSLSGGELTRLQLAGLLLQAPDILLLDEPTNHLDIAGLEWLESFVNDYRGPVVLVSHDREFLERVPKSIAAINPASGKVTVSPGNYSAYIASARAESERASSTYRLQQAKIRRTEEDIARRKEYAQRTETATNNDVSRRLAKKVAKLAKSRERKLERFKASAEIVERPEREWSVKLDFMPVQRGGQLVIDMAGVGHGFSGAPLFLGVELRLTYGERVALVGPNGCGKSTLLRAVTGELAPDSGTINTGAGARLGFLSQTSTLAASGENALGAVRGAAQLDETEARNFLHFFLFAGDAALRPVAALSHGERQRLQLALLVAGGANCLVLDEPTNHLDIPSREQLEQALSSFPGAVIAATHDRAFIDRWATAVWGFVDGPTIRRFADRQDYARAARSHDSGREARVSHN